MKTIFITLIIGGALTLFLGYSIINAGSINSEKTTFKPLPKIETTELNFLGHWLNEGHKERVLKEAINEFEFRNKDVKININYLEKLIKGNESTIDFAKYNARFISSEKPEWDIVRVNNDFWNIGKRLNDTGWIKKYLVDFSEIDEFRNTTRPELLTNEVKLQYGGIIPGPFIDGYNWLLWCNTEVAKKVGIEVKQFGMTNEDFVAYLKAVDDYNKTHNDHIMSIFEAGDFRTTHTIAEELFYSEMGNYDEIKNTNFSEKKLAAWEKVLHEMERLAKYNPVSKDWINKVWSDCTGYPLEEKCLFYSNASWMHNIWNMIDSSKTSFMVPCEMPVFRSSPAYIGGYNITWAVPKNAPHRDQAIRFLLQLNSINFASKLVKVAKAPCGVKGYQGRDGFC